MKTARVAVQPPIGLANVLACQFRKKWEIRKRFVPSATPAQNRLATSWNIAIFT
jgi:hypothetical protein